MSDRLPILDELFQDKRRSYDPTGTTHIRQKFRGEASRRLSTVMRMMRIAIVEHNVLGMITPREVTANSRLPSPISKEQKLRAFGDWFSSVITNVLVSEGTWAVPYLESAYGSGAKAAAKYVTTDPDKKLDGVFRQLAAQELRGIANATVHSASRAAAQYITRDDRARKMFLHVAASVQKTARPRLNSLANTMTVQLHNIARVDQFKHAGIDKFGFIPEGRPNITKPLPIVRDHKLIDRRRRVELFGVLTANDDLVCQICEDLESEGPYTEAAILGTIPAHLNCRCAIVPWDDMPDEFESDDLEDSFHDYSPDQPRDPDGKFGSGGSGGGTVIGSAKATAAKHISEVKEFVSGKSVGQVLREVAGSEKGKEALSFALQSLVSHAVGLDQSTWKMNEDLIEHAVHHFSDGLAITKVQGKDMMQRAVKGLIAMRTAAFGARKVKDADVDDDLILKWLHGLDEALEKYDPSKDEPKEPPQNNEEGK